MYYNWNPTEILKTRCLLLLVTGSVPEGKGDIYYDKVYNLDANANYFLSKRWVIFANANNLLNQAQRRYMWQPQYTYYSLYTGTTAQVGVKVNVF